MTCGREGRHYVTAPVAIFEILSPATELADRTDKRRDYQRLASLRHYVLIAQDEPRVEIYSRRGQGWRFEELEGRDATLTVGALGIELPLAEIYEGLSFPGVRGRAGSGRRLTPCTGALDPRDR